MRRLIVLMTGLLLTLWSSTGRADIFDVAGFQFDDEFGPTTVTPVPPLEVADFFLSPRQFIPISEQGNEFDLEKTTGFLLDPEFSTPGSFVELGGFDHRETIELTWDGPSGVFNNAGDDLVVYELGSPGSPEAYMVSVREAGSATFSGFRYEFFEEETSFDPLPDEAFLATGFDLSDLGLASGASIDAIRIANLMEDDRVDDASGQGNVLFDGTGFQAKTGPLGPGGPYAESKFDADIQYVGVLVSATTSADVLQAGDADQDLDFDQFDLIQVQVAAKYLTGQPATWGEGDWNGAPGGSPGNPPPGNGFFDQLDIIAAIGPGIYLTGPYAAIAPDGTPGDGQTSIIYNPGTGEVTVDAPAGTELTSINIDSAAGIFTGQPAQNLGGSFDHDADDNIFKATFGNSFGDISFGSVAQTGLTREFVLSDLTVVGSLAGGGELGSVDLIYVPEPGTTILLLLGAVAALALRRWR